MTNFSLIKDLDKNKGKQINPEIDRIQYQRFNVNVSGKFIPIEIPVRESENFEKFSEKLKNVERYELKNDELKYVLRYFRGKKVRDEE